ncbi:hypothetical protein TVAG_198740 [Trichomonas vaginalis G3]|uniref:Uncharacterized protein n=1 Tax=Trichomonas vaginalis (strain ATCC PRA-98 / G3) TaxID=412133 RepID=A2DDQ9_TRIV3|nr:hypothetical protein TVAGG3_0999170 [Trichomonas vaginalis G3]EAY21435.1 hypothetical protein TVAG_198740 [Trichomonas vaginalis G3]KAI5490648.1 hypothetical protein TVAGG3_0999170 [Trichomonas vaginalis G3]|eukprot:XP_001582421.1 hypothetical protein [Trichomonas vaginalis G3]
MCSQKIDQLYKKNPKHGFVFLQDRAYFKHFFKSHSNFAKNSKNSKNSDDILKKFSGVFWNFGLKIETDEKFQNFAKPFEQELDKSSYEKAMKYTKYDIDEVISDKILAKSETICVYKVKYPGDVYIKDITIIKNDIVKDGYLPLSIQPDFVSADNMYSLYTISQGRDISYIVGPAFPDDEFTNTFYSTKKIDGNKLINDDIIKKFDKYQPEIYSEEYYSDYNEEKQYYSDQSDNDHSEEKQYYSDQSDNDHSEEKQYYSDQSDNDHSEEKQYYSDQSDNDHSEEKQEKSEQPDNDHSEEKQYYSDQSDNDHSEEKQEKSEQPDTKITFAVRHSCIAKFKYTHTFYNTVDKPDQLDYPSNVLLQIEEYCKFAHNAIKSHSNSEQKVRLFGYCNGGSEFLDSIDKKYKTSFSKVTSLGIFSEFEDDILNICVIEPNIDIKYLQESVKSVNHIDSTVILSHGPLQDTDQEKEEFNNFETIAKILAIYVTLVQFRDIDFKTIIDITGLRYVKDKTSQKPDDTSSRQKGKSSRHKGKSSRPKDNLSEHKGKPSKQKGHSSGQKSKSYKRK